MLYQVILMLHMFAAVCIVALVLIQQGKGASMGAGFGSGASQTVFGSRGSGSFLFKVTMGFMIAFFITSIGLNYIATRVYKTGHVITLPSSKAEPVQSEQQSSPSTSTGASGSVKHDNRILPTLPASSNKGPSEK